MSLVATEKKKTPGSKKPFPSRASVKYVAVPKEYHAVLEQLSQESEDPKAFSINFFARKAIREFLEKIGRLPQIKKSKPGKPKTDL